MSELNRKLDMILKKEEHLDNEEKEILKREKRIEKEESKVENEETDELSLQLQELGELKKLRKELTPDVIKRMTVRDIIRGSFGAFVGTVLNYNLLWGIEVAKQMDMTKATLLYPISFVIGMVFLYATGYKKIKEKKSVILLLPMRMIVIFMVSLIISILVLMFFHPGFMADFDVAYKQTAAVLLLAVVGACTADLIGRS